MWTNLHELLSFPPLFLMIIVVNCLAVSCSLRDIFPSNRFPDFFLTLLLPSYLYPLYPTLSVSLAVIIYQHLSGSGNTGIESKGKNQANIHLAIYMKPWHVSLEKSHPGLFIHKTKSWLCYDKKGKEKKIMHSNSDVT